jgi:hypothetical protein
MRADVAMPFISGICTRDPENCPKWVESNIFDALYWWNLVAVNLWTRPLPLAFGRLIWRLRAQKWPLETVKRRENRDSLATEYRQTA